MYLTLTLCARLHQSAPAPVAPGWSINNPRGCEVGRFPAITGGNSDVISLLIRKKGVGESIYIYIYVICYILESSSFGCSLEGYHISKK